MIFVIVFIGFAILLTTSAYLAYSLDGIKVYSGIGLGMQILGFASLLTSQTRLPIKDRELFDKLFHKLDNVIAEVQGGTHLGRYTSGIWLVMLGLTIQVIALFIAE